MFKKNLLIISVLALLLLPTFAFAIDVPGLPIVFCGLSSQDNPSTPQIEGACTRCDLFRLLKNIIDFTVGGLMPPVAILLFVWAGFLILLGGANTNLVAQGRQIFTTTFFGIIIMLSAWMITNTLIQSVGAKYNNAQNWWQFTCEETAPAVPPIVRPPVGLPPTCDNPQQLAQQNSVPFPRRNAPELDQLISCIRSNMPGQNLGSEFTYDQSKEICNYTRGQRTCSSTCSHAVNSCHYGGRTGSAGSLAVDFGNEAIGRQIIQAAQSCGVPSGKARCENAAGRNVGCAVGSGATHVHISAASCDAN